MSRDVPGAVIPYTKELPVDYRVATYMMFMSTYGPYEYSSWQQECLSWKETCMIGDWTPLSKMLFTGPDVINFFQTITGLSAKNFSVGQAKHIVCPSRRGKVIGDGILLRRSQTEFLLTGGPNLIGWSEFKLAKSSFATTAMNVTDDMFIFQVQGPNSVTILSKLVDEDLRDIPYMHALETELCGTKVFFLRQGMSGNIGFELQGSSEKGVEVYNAILEAGKDLGITRVGELSKGVNHVEACFPTPTWDYTPDVFDENDPEMAEFRQLLGPAVHFWQGHFSLKAPGSADNLVADSLFSPVELGWGYSLAFDHDFPGADILKEEKTNPKRLVCTLEWDDRDVQDVYNSMHRDGEPYKFMVMPRSYEIAPDRVMKDGKQVGISMSRCHSIWFHKTISLCVLDASLCILGTHVEVIWGANGMRQKAIRARVALTPYYDPNKKRNLNE